MTGKALRSVRLALSLTLFEFSERIGIPDTELDAFERGDQLLDTYRLSAALERLTPDALELMEAEPLLRAVLPPQRSHAEN
jgi:transcriptional regulator with XRE-family HTH domain